MQIFLLLGINRSAMKVRTLTQQSTAAGCGTTGEIATVQNTASFFQRVENSRALFGTGEFENQFWMNGGCPVARPRAALKTNSPNDDPLGPGRTAHGVRTSVWRRSPSRPPLSVMPTLRPQWTGRARSDPAEFMRNDRSVRLLNCRSAEIRKAVEWLLTAVMGTI